ncbi:MAG: acyltransferase [Williamsia sp.]|nr:acyltransferase [Williamsia sp.]
MLKFQNSEIQSNIAEPMRPYYPELDALRFIAFIIFFFHHVFPRETNSYLPYVSETLAEFISTTVNALAFGLPLFFFLSALLLTKTLLIEKERTGSISVTNFYIRRGLRIWPLYYLGIAIGAAFFLKDEIKGVSAEPDRWMMICMYVVMLGNWFYASGMHHWSYSPATPLWGISIDQQFCCFWPIVIKFSNRLTISVISAIVFTVALFAAYALGNNFAERDTTIWTNSFVQFGFFAVGAVCAICLPCRTYIVRSTSRILLFLLSILLWSGSNFIFQAKVIGSAPNGWSIIIGYGFAAVGCVTILLSIWNYKNWHPLIIFLGKISYGLYVFQELALLIVEKVLALVGQKENLILHVFVDVTVGLCITISIATASYRFFEAPFLRLKKQFSAY